MKFIKMAAVHILILGEIAGFKIVPFIATHVKKKNSWSYEKKKKKPANQNSPICMKRTGIKLLQIYQNVDASFGKYYGIQMQKQRGITK